MSRKIEPIYVKLSKLIVLRRKELGMTQFQLAKKIKVSRSYLANIELGRQRIYLHHLLKLEQALESTLLLKFVKQAIQTRPLGKGCIHD